MASIQKNLLDRGERPCVKKVLQAGPPYIGYPHFVESDFARGGILDRLLFTIRVLL